MPIEKLKPNYTFTEDKIEQLKEILPEAFADGKINFETLKEALGEYLEEENQDREHFGLFWVGKRQARKIASIPSKGTLVPVKDEGINEENTKNIFIEGDNLEVLKLLQKSYANKIKMIYIDPPYNTGNDFVYEDDFSEPIKEYLRKTGQVDDQGRDLTTNKKSDGRYHAKWLSMMYPRLSLARNLMQDDGLIFISIDDNEVHNLRLLCNEIFGEENFISEFIWHSRQNVDSRSLNGASIDHEYILCYSKNSNVRIRGKEIDKNKYTNPDNDPRGPWMSSPMDGIATKDKRPNLHYTITNFETGLTYNPSPENGWRFQRSTVDELIKDKRIIWAKNPNSKPRFKRYLNELNNDFTGFSSILNVDFTSQGTKELRALMGIETFKFPKPVSLIKELLKQGLLNNEYVLDFFAGSGTTSQAVYELNKEDNGNRKFICVQIPEKIKEASDAYNEGYKNIAEITKERIRRAIKKIKSENEEKMNSTPNLFSSLSQEGQEKQDLGFKVFKLQESNYKEWKDFEGKNTNQLEISFDNALSPLIQNWQKDGLLSEIMIIEGFTLDSKVNILSEYTTNQIYEVNSDFCSHKLLVCLDEKLEKTTIDSLSIEENDIFICLDSAIDDNNKIILSDKGLIKTI